jgi:hypothetical protein
MHQNETLRAASRLLATVEAGQAAALALAANYLSVRSAAAIREHLHEPMLDHSYLPDAVFERRLSVERVRRGIAPVSLAFEGTGDSATIPPARGPSAPLQPPARLPRPSGLAARLGSLASPAAVAKPVATATQSNEEATSAAKPASDRRADERIARRIALGNSAAPETPVTPAAPDTSAIAPLVVPPELLPHEPSEDSGLDALAAAAPESDYGERDYSDAGDAASTDSAPKETEEAPPSPTPATTLRSLAATLGGISASTPAKRAVAGPASALPLSSPRPTSLPPTGLVQAPTQEEILLDGPYITRETKHPHDLGGRSAAAVDLRAIARAVNQAAGGEEPLPLEGQDGAGEDTSDDDSSEGMRVHFEVAARKPAAPVGNRLSFENDDLTVVHGDDREPTNLSPRPEVIDRIEHQRSEESVLLQFLDTARVLTERGDYNKAIQAYTDALDVRLSHPEAYIGRGRCQMELGDYTSAMSDFRRAEDLQPRHPDPQAAMGDLYFARKEYKRAIEFYDQAVELDGAHAMARCRRGISHYYRKNYRQAFQDLQRANALDPEIPNIKKYVQMALKKMERGE